MSVAPLILLGAGTVLSTIATLREGQQMATAESYNARVAEAQVKAVRESAAFQSETFRKQTELQEQTLTAQSKVEQAKLLREKGKTLSAQRAAYAKAGVRIDEGTPLDVMADTAANYELDLAVNRYNLESSLYANRYNLATGLEAIRYGAETDVARLQSEAEYRRRLGKSYKTASYLKAGSTLLTGLAAYGALGGFGGATGSASKGTKVISVGRSGYGKSFI